MKGPICAQYMASEALKRSGIDLKGDLIFQCVAGEETNEHAIGTTAVLEAGYTGDAAIVSEPSSLLEPLQICRRKPSAYI